MKLVKAFNNQPLEPITIRHLDMTRGQKFVSDFREIQSRFTRFYAALLPKLGLTLPQYAFLNQLARTGTIPMTHASRILCVSKPAVTNLVDRLEKNKYLVRLAHPNDRRVNLVKLLPKGARIVRKVQEQVLRILLKTLAEFSESDRRAVLAFYHSLASRLAHEFDHITGKKARVRNANL